MLGVIEVSHAPAWSQVHLVPKPDGKWRFTLDFVQLEGWPIPNISDTLKRIGDAKPTVFGLECMRKQKRSFKKKFRTGRTPKL